MKSAHHPGFRPGMSTVFTKAITKVELWQHLLDLAQIRQGPVPAPKQTPPPTTLRPPGLDSPAPSKVPSPEERQKKKRRTGGKGSITPTSTTATKVQSAAPTVPSTMSMMTSNGEAEVDPPPKPEIQVSPHTTYRVRRGRTHRFWGGGCSDEAFQRC